MNGVRLFRALTVAVLTVCVGCGSTPRPEPEPRTPLREELKLPLDVAVMYFSDSTGGDYSDLVAIESITAVVRQISRDFVAALDQMGKFRSADLTENLSKYAAKELKDLSKEGYDAVFITEINHLRFSGGPRAWSVLPPVGFLWLFAGLGMPVGPVWYRLSADLHIELVSTQVDTLGEQLWRSNPAVHMDLTRYGISWANHSELVAGLHQELFNRIVEKLSSEVKGITRSDVADVLPHRLPLPEGAWAVVVGVSDYRYADTVTVPNLRYAHTDAEDFGRALVRDLGWAPQRVKVLTNEGATYQAVRDAVLGWLRAQEDDLIVFFWSGHGVPDSAGEREFYFACHDTPPGKIWRGYSMAEVHRQLELRNPRNVVFIADTCHAGGVTHGDPRVASRGPLAAPPASFNWVPADDQIPRGWIYLLAADSEGTAKEHPEIEHGLFTHLLLKALREADTYKKGDGDAIVTLREIGDYLEDTMEKASLECFHSRRRPVLRASTRNEGLWELDLRFPAQRASPPSRPGTE